MASKWYYQRDGKEHGPIATADLERLASTGQLSPSDIIWREGLPNWFPAAKLTGLWGGKVPVTTPAAPPAPAPPPPSAPAASAGLAGIDYLTAETLSIETLRQVFDAAMFDVGLEKDGDLVVKDRYRGYVSINGRDKNIIRFAVYFGVKAEVSESAAHALCNRINKELLIVRLSMTGPNMNINWDLPPLGAIAKKTVIAAFRKFMEQAAAIPDYDTDKLLK